MLYYLEIQLQSTAEFPYFLIISTKTLILHQQQIFVFRTFEILGWVGGEFFYR